MLHFLFLVNQEYPYFPGLKKAAKERQVEIDIVYYDDIEISYRKNQAQLLVHGNEVPAYDLVHFRHTSHMLEKSLTLAEYFRHTQTVITDAAFRFSVPWIYSKNFTYMRLVHENLPIIDTSFLSEKTFAERGNVFSFPVVVKISDGSQGEGVHLCKSIEEVKTIFAQYKKDLLIQEYIPNDGDIRVLVLGTQVLGAIKRKSSSTAEFRNNFSLGGSVEMIELDAQAQVIAQKAAQALQYDFAGIDLVWDSQNLQWKILEVNQSPQFGGFMEATHVDIPEKLIEYFIACCRN